MGDIQLLIKISLYKNIEYTCVPGANYDFFN